MMLEELRMIRGASWETPAYVVRGKTRKYELGFDYDGNFGLRPAVAITHAQSNAVRKTAHGGGWHSSGSKTLATSMRIDLPQYVHIGDFSFRIARSNNG